jgi:hypothetical protein
MRRAHGFPAIPPMTTPDMDTVTTMTRAMTGRPDTFMGMILPIIPISSPTFPAVSGTGTGQRRNAGRAR